MTFSGDSWHSRPMNTKLRPQARLPLRRDKERTASKFAAHAKADELFEKIKIEYDNEKKELELKLLNVINEFIAGKLSISELNKLISQFRKRGTSSKHTKLLVKNNLMRLSYNHSNKLLRYIKSSDQSYNNLIFRIIFIVNIFIEQKKHKDHIYNNEDRLNIIELYVQQNGSSGVKDFIRAVFHELYSPEVEKNEPHESYITRNADMPNSAPEIYPGLRGPETPPEFVKRVYGEWLGKGLTRADIRKLDPKLSIAINNWLSRPGNEWPTDVDLPTLKEQNDRDLERLESHGINELVSGDVPATTIREAQRLLAAKARRSRE
jgi:hypothetical protein